MTDAAAISGTSDTGGTRGSAVIVARGVKKAYRDDGLSVEVLRGIDLDVRSGEVLAVVGASGSGKSTLLHCLGGLDAIDSGSIAIGGRELASLDETERGALRNRTLGASPRSIMGIFILQGGLIGIFGTLLGVAGGLLLACNLGVIVPAIERLFGVHFLDPSIYFISALPSDPQAADIVPIVLISLLLSLLATLYPSWRASRVQPAQALRYD